MSARCSSPFCPFPATRQSYADEYVAETPWVAENFTPWCAGHAPRSSWPLVESEGSTTPESTDSDVLPGHPVMDGAGYDCACGACLALRTESTDLAEQGRQLASERDDLIAQGVDPGELEVPLHPQSTDLGGDVE